MSFQRTDLEGNLAITNSSPTDLSVKLVNEPSKKTDLEVGNLVITNLQRTDLSRSVKLLRRTFNGPIQKCETPRYNEPSKD
ncbi:hypothetical protein AVEN_267981-1 [Araneus ventricosus]|uniref:Uncharacterized protein n=1 Tax=Araneus ventricosus TaxID=182803 RepID=A0A4Y2IXE6_ARAVE|nr:hypothetical protein AVEN_267981-1 [Araneus ventricosus]